MAKFASSLPGTNPPGGELLLFPEKDCTPRCHSRGHARNLLSCVTKGTSAEIRSYCNWLCHNFMTVTDEWGRNILHIAASTGKWAIVQWLLEHCHCDVNVRDLESGWTALHRSFFYGQLACARVLLDHGANLKMVDHDGFTPLDLIAEDRLPYIEYDANYPQDVYVWGSNVNYNLGLGNEQARTYPEALEIFRKENATIKQVVMCKFHTVFLLGDGRLYTCGHGHGGRLGQRTESTGLSPSPVQGLGPSRCLFAAAGQDHLVLLMDGGQVWTCGLNTYHQLGHNPPPERLLTPKPISLKFLKGKEVIGVCAARYHSVFYTKDCVFTFGLNAGQLGHPKGDRTIIAPHQVSGVYNKDWLISHVAASDGATVCATNRGDVYVLHEYQHRKIASKQLGIRMLSVVGGHLDSRCDAAGIIEGGGLELRVVILTQSGKLYLWRHTNPYLRRCLFTSSIQPVILDVHINHYNVTAVTHNNKAIIGNILPFKDKKVSSMQVSSPTPPKSQGTCGQINAFIDRDDCYFIRAKRLPFIHRATSITSDTKGRNFAVLQASPKIGLVELPVVSESQMQKQMLRLLEESSVNDAFHDVIVKIGHKEYPAHKYILASRSEYFRKNFQNVPDRTVITIDNIIPEAFEQILKYLYGNTCDFLHEGYEVRWGRVLDNVCNNNNIENNKNKDKLQKNVSKKKNKTKVKVSDPVECVQEASRFFNIHALTKMLQHVKIVNGKIHISCKDQLPKLRFDRLKLTDFHDVSLRSEDGIEFPAHRCMLAARSDYFHSMLGACWLEKSQLKCITLPIPSKILNALLNYLYSDADTQINGSEDPEFLCNILVVADQLLITHLKEMCEMGLVDLLTLKNAPELLQLASIYSADQLKKACMEYICINLPAVIESKNLDVLSDDVMEELSKTYRTMVPSMQRRVITPCASSPSREELSDLEKCFPVHEEYNVPKQKIESYNLKSGDFKWKTKRKVPNSPQETRELVFENTKPRCDSESSEKGILLDMVSVNEENQKFVDVPITSPIKIPVRKPVTFFNPESPMQKPWQWASSKVLNELVSLDDIMKEERKMVVLQKSNSCAEIKQKLPHLSQKQKKLVAQGSAQQLCISPGILPNSITVCSSPPNCPWGKTAESTESSPSFWDAIAKGELQSPPSASPKRSSGMPSSMSSMSLGSEEEPCVISLEAIQKAEEEKQHRSVPLMAKPLSIINIEDQAIEELLILYRAEDNARERITVSRVLPENIANPVWKKNAARPLQL